MPAIPENTCERCEKPETLCVCEGLTPYPNRKRVLILQHPQEPDKELGSARLAQLSLERSTLRVGLSWPNLKAAIGPAAADLLKGGEVVPSRWAVLYLGSGIQSDAPAGPSTRPASKPGLHFVSQAGKPISAPSLSELDGLVVLDGTWSQAKTLWWRNAWLLKLKRVILVPEERSLYRELRKEPRGECLSTIESIAEALEGLGEPAELKRALKANFGKLLEKYRSSGRVKKRDWRRKRR